MDRCPVLSLLLLSDCCPRKHISIKYLVTTPFKEWVPQGCSYPYPMEAPHLKWAIFASSGTIKATVNTLLHILATNYKSGSMKILCGHSVCYYSCLSTAMFPFKMAERLSKEKYNSLMVCQSQRKANIFACLLYSIIFKSVGTMCSSDNHKIKK